MAVRCQPCQAVLGAEVEGVHLRQVPDAATIDVLEEALERYGVLIFPAQHLTPHARPNPHPLNAVACRGDGSGSAAGGPPARGSAGADCGPD